MSSKTLTVNDDTAEPWWGLEKYELIRIDRRGFSSQGQVPYLTVTDILHARRACGLTNSCPYREVSNIVLSRSRQ